MNTRYVLFNLREAAEDIEQAIAQVEENKEHELYARLPFVYRKLNRAWNCRHMSDGDLKKETEEDFERKCDLPEDLRDSIS